MSDSTDFEVVDRDSAGGEGSPGGSGPESPAAGDGGPPEGSDGGVWERFVDWFKSPKGWKGYAGRALLVLVVFSIITAPFSEDPGNGATDGADGSTGETEEGGGGGAGADSTTNTPPTAERVSPTDSSLTATAGESFQVEAQCQNPDENLDHALWEVRNPGTSSFELDTRDEVQLQGDPWGPKIQSFSFSSEGDAAIRWTCVDENGDSNSTQWEIHVQTVNNTPPTAERVSPSDSAFTATANESFKVKAQCQNPDENLDHALWEVREPGASSFQLNSRDDVQLQGDPWGPKTNFFSFSSGGDAAIRWTCVDPNGDSNSTHWEVHVTASNSPPDASFTRDCSQLSCTFDASGSTDSDGHITDYQWDFGDGATATGPIADHTYSTEGTYTVELTVTDNRSASDNDLQDVTVEGPVTTLFSDEISTSGLTAAASEQGTRIGFGLDNGDVVVYDDQGTSDYHSMSATGGVSQLAVSTTHDRMNVAWMDDHLFGALTLAGEEKWSYTYQGLWNVDWNANRSITAAVSNPSEGTGGVGYGVEGDVQWTNDFDDATGWTVAVSEQGNYVAVGADEYWNGSDYTGSPGVRMYDSQGALLWEHGTSSGVISIGVHAGQDVVVAGTDEGKLLVFDLSGEILWSDPDKGGWVHLSQDGSTIVSPHLGELIAYDTSGNELWRADPVGSIDGEKVQLSESGSMVLSLGYDGNATIIDAGEVFWSQRYDGPIGGDISDDGTTWGIIMQDNEERDADVWAYRDQR